MIRQGQRAEAQRILHALIQAEPQNVLAWLWYIDTFLDWHTRLRLLELCAQRNPTDERVRRALQTLRLQHKEELLAGRVTPPAPSASVVPSPSKTSSLETSASPARFVAAAKSVGAGSASSEVALPAKSSKRLTWLWLLEGTVFILCLVGILVGAKSLPASLVGLDEIFKTTNPTDYRYEQPVEYYLYPPEDYTPEQIWPLFIGIHGSGGSGLDCWNLWQKYADEEGFVLLCPTLSDAGGGWYQTDGEQKLLSILSQIEASYRVDRRAFLVGFSAGAQFVQGFAFHYPSLVRGVAVLSAGNYYPAVSAARGIPFLVVIGDADSAAAVYSSSLFVTELTRKGFRVHYEVLPGVGHTVTESGKNLTLALYRQVYGK